MRHTYILECSDSSLYVGITRNLKDRLKRHNDGSASEYTKDKRPVRLIYSKQYSTKSLARRMELQIKKLRRDKKLRLVNKDVCPSP